MKPADVIELLREFYRDKASIRQRHVAGARFVTNYDFNNTYQYVIAREDVQLRWLIDAIADLGGTVDVADASFSASGKGEQAQASILREDSNGAQGFVDRWRDRVEKVTNARNRNMLRVILGETMEHKRFFDQAIAGREDLLGRRADGAGTGGGVMPTRWVE
ncbi:MAG: hypothetical protein DMF84_05235 [Acidobacteria bacterium]|nr:MAG: hypothetical protein DMF84_05235 [Acidobacteriota bacterium]